jgi:GT2 family glycosyltransferase
MTREIKFRVWQKRTQLIISWDDIDNCLAVKKKGWKIIYCGSSVGIHYPRATRGSDSLDAQYRNLQNAEAFYRRWGYWEQYLQSQNRQTFLQVEKSWKENHKVAA